MRTALSSLSPTCSPFMVWESENITLQAAQALARVTAIGNAVIELHGGLGAGKTTFARYLLQALGITGRVKSPTYTVVEAYETAGLASNFFIWHFDFYRFNDPQEWEDAGFRDIFASSGLKLIEWPEQAGDLLPKADVQLSITADTFNQHRQIQVQAGTALGTLIVQNWLLQLSAVG